MNRSHIIILLLMFAYPLQTFGDCQLKGKVSDDNNLPIANADVEVERSGDILASVKTDTSGRYLVNFQAFPNQQIRAVKLKFTANGYNSDFLNVIRQGDCFANRDDNVTLTALDGSAVIASSTGLKILVAQFKLYGNVEDDQTNKFNTDLPEYLYHRISVYKSSLPKSTASFDISVESIQEPLSVAAGEKIQQLGVKRNALGVVAGDGTVTSQNPSELALNSVFRTIPAYKNTKILHAPIVDSVPLGNFSPSSVGKEMQDHWGKQAMLSYVLQQLVNTRNTLPTEERNALYQLLIDVRGTMKKTDHLLPVLEELLAIVEEPLT